MGNRTVAEYGGSGALPKAIGESGALPKAIGESGALTEGSKRRRPPASETVGVRECETGLQ